MANKKPDDRLITHYGRMNRIAKPLVGPVIDLDESSTIEVLTEIAKERHEPNVFSGAGPYRAQVLRIEERRRPEAGTDPDTPEHDIFVRENKDKAVYLVRVKARIPELHAGLPMPTGLGDGDGEYQKVIDMYPSFTAAFDEISLGDLAVGDPVWVDFVDKVNFKDGVLLGAIKKAAGGSSGTKESAASARDGACAGSYAAGGAKPSGDSLPLSNKAKSLAGAPLTRRRSANVMSGEFVFIEDGFISKKVIKLWEKSAKRYAPSGKSSWAKIGKFKTLVYKPNVTDPATPKEYIWFFPPQEMKLTSDSFDTVAKTCFELATEGRNYILIMTLPNPPPKVFNPRTALMATRAENLASDDVEFDADVFATPFVAEDGATQMETVLPQQEEENRIRQALRHHNHRYIKRTTARGDQSHFALEEGTNIRIDLREGEELWSRSHGIHNGYGRMPLDFGRGENLDEAPGARGVRTRTVPVVEEFIPNVGYIRLAWDRKLQVVENPSEQLPIENYRYSFLWILPVDAEYDPHSHSWTGPLDGPYIEWFFNNLESMMRNPGASSNPPTPYDSRRNIISGHGNQDFGEPTEIRGLQRDLEGNYYGWTQPIPVAEPEPEPAADPTVIMNFARAMGDAAEGDSDEPNDFAAAAALFGGDADAGAGFGLLGGVEGEADPRGIRSGEGLLNPQIDQIRNTGLGGGLLYAYFAQDHIERREWLGKVNDRLIDVFSATPLEGDSDTYVSIGTGANILQTCTFGALPHCSPKRVNMIRPTSNFHPDFLSSMASLARDNTTEQGYVEFDLNIILEPRARKDFFEKLKFEARTLVGNVYEVDGSSSDTETDKAISERWVTVVEQPEIDGFKYVGYISQRHIDALKQASPSLVEEEPFFEDPQGNEEEGEENDVERDVAAGVAEPNTTPQQRPAPQDPPEIPPPTSPSATPKSSFTPKKAAQTDQAVAFKENRVRLKDYGILTRENERNLLVDVPNTKGPGKVKLHVLAAARFNALRSAAASAGFDDVRLASGYRRHRWRSWEHYKEYVTERYGSVREGRKYMAYQSPHETGLAIDFGNNGMSPRKAKIPEMKRARFYKWLKDNAHKYGFTPYKREPWHWEVRIPYNAWASGKDFVAGGIESYAVRVTDIGSKDIAIGDTSAPVGTAVASNAPVSKPCVDRIGSTGTRENPNGATIPGSGGLLGKQAPVVPHPQDKFTIISGSPCNGCHRRLNKLTELFVLHETGGNPNTASELQRRRWAKHNQAKGALNKAVHLWQGIDGKFLQESPLEQNLPHANTLNPWSFGVEVGSFSTDAVNYGGPVSKIMKGLHVLGDPNHKIGKQSDMQNPNTNGYKYRAIQIPQEIQFEKIWQFVLWATTSEIPSVSGTKIDIPMNFPGIASDNRFYFSAMGFGNPVPTVKEGDAYKWSRKEKPRGIMAHARVHHADGLPLEYYCIQRAKGMDRKKAFYSVIGALCSMDKRKGVELMAPDSYAQVGLSLYPWTLNHPTQYDTGKQKWAALDKTKYGLSIV